MSKNQERKTWIMYRRADITPCSRPDNLPTENLVFALDGLYNVKGGHSNKANYWLDLVTGEPSDFPINPNNWTDRGYKLTGDTLYSVRKYLVNSNMAHAVHIFIESVTDESTGVIVSVQGNSGIQNICSSNGLKGYPANRLQCLTQDSYFTSDKGRSILITCGKSYHSNWSKNKYQCYAQICTENGAGLTHSTYADIRGTSYSNVNPKEITIGHQAASVVRPLTDNGIDTYGNNIIINAIRVYTGASLPFTGATAHEAMYERFPNR